MAESKGRRSYYEGMFLVSQATAQDLAGCVEHITEAVSRAHGEVIALRKWDERRLAYEIKKFKRGVYFLAYFEADPAFIGDAERFLNLSETMLRFMITKVEHMTEDQMRAQDDSARLRDEARVKGQEAPSAPAAPQGEPAAAAPVEAGAESGEG